MHTYGIYYGWLTQDARGAPNADAQRLAAARLPLVIAHYWTAPPTRHRNLSAAVLALLRAAGTRVFAYIATGWGAADQRMVMRQINEYAEGGVDGIFFDEADALVQRDRFVYYEALARHVRGAGLTLILNPGVARCGEAIMEVADAVMVEHQWRDLRTSSLWAHRYAADRFMGVSSNEERAMGYTVDASCALEDTHRAWASGIGWHTSTDRYATLPDWFEAYAARTCTRE